MTEPLALSIVIPIYNEEENIEPLFGEVQEVLRQFGRPFEIIFVDDGSSDQSRSILERLAQQHEEVRVIGFRRNFGQALAMQCGFDHASKDLVIPMDGDGQNDPKEIPKMVRYLEEHNLDVVSGWRKNRKDKFLRSLFSRTANWLIGKVTGVRLHDYGCSLKVYRREVLQNIRLYGEMHRFIPTFLYAKGAKIAEVEVHHRPRHAGTSKYGLNRTFKVMADLFTVQFLTHYLKKPGYFFGKLTLAFLFLFLACLLLSLWLYPSLSFLFPLAFAPVFLLIGILCWLAVPLSELWARTYWASSQDVGYTIGYQVGFDKISKKN